MIDQLEWMKWREESRMTSRATWVSDSIIYKMKKKKRKRFVHVKSRRYHTMLVKSMIS